MAGCIATCCVQPIDMVKVRIQIMAAEHPGESFGPLKVSRMVYAQEGGLTGFYKGLDSALMR